MGIGGIRELDPVTGAVRKNVADQASRLMSGVAVSARSNRPSLVWQLMLQDGVAVARDPASLTEVRRAGFRGEGWGLCDDGNQLVQSDGTAKLILRNADTFEEEGSVEVTDGWWRTGRLGELECVEAGGRREVWAVLSGTSWMIRVDITTSAVTAVADLAPVMAAAAGVAADQTINAVAAIPNAANEFWVSGAGWRTTWRVRLMPRA